MKPSNHLTVLAIETSCDDTSIAVLEIRNWRLKILSNVISSQIKIHKKWGGVYPILAKREHQKNLPLVLKKALRKASLANPKSQIPNPKQIPNFKFQTLKEILKRDPQLFKDLVKFFSKHEKPEIDLITVTVGPGLEPCLWVGVNFAKALAFFWRLPIIPVNHIEAHILVNFIDDLRLTTHDSRLFPAICLVVSGGHTQLILIRNIGKYKIIGETRDDAAGECFDKIARILGLGYPGGPAIEKQAAHLQPTTYNLQPKLPRPMIHQKNFDFSFSGLKTAVLYHHQNQPKKIRKSKKYIQAISAETQQAIIDVLIKKTIRAAKKYKAKTVILGGGVVANKELRRQFQQKIKKEIPHTKYLIPDTKFATDNAVMIGIAGFYTWLNTKGVDWKKIKAKANLRIS